MRAIITFLLFLLPIPGLLAQFDPEPKKWYVPDLVKMQFAGNIGFLSAGVGYEHGKGKLETDLMLGFLPKSIGGDHITSLSAKMTWSPWKISKGRSRSLELTPFTLGPYMSYSFGSQFDTILPNEYPSGYYWWATSLRFGAFFGGNVEIPLASEQSIKGIGFYYELGTYDLKFISYVLNRKFLNVTDIFSLALGVRFQLD